MTLVRIGRYDRCGDPSDSVHLNEAGYEIVKTTVQAKLTALGL